MKEYIIEIGKSFRHLRESRNVEREYIAAKCGVSTRAIAKLEEGKTDVGLGKMMLYLDAMDATLKDLLGLLPRSVQITASSGSDDI